ncbi:hypothetical protein C0Q70_08436 [Pomacea canaliculata]|uniref:Nudix hydrolase domain-containing protein n=2 Tax=Pomacea canaliculata TaxID=400727 RepID=A0A2T7PHU0_POMCA|nr:ADP-ribose pyrophosphatase, mitochondrial-like isoform X2 [Pomacea canaliculata]PVD32988.1 hypothetical protein C0Q70_08436 [Pomacea canaliculata]
MGGSMSKITSVTKLAMEIHIKARSSPYQRTTDVKRFPVPDEKVPWNVDFPEYKPVDYTAPSVQKGPVWADIDVRTADASQQPIWNKLDNGVNRVSHMGPYKIVDKCPRNPIGRTGMIGRGLLGRWGPNHAADPIVTRWKRNISGEVVNGEGGRPILQAIVVQRRDNGEWALPGGMVDPGEVVTMAVRREFGEEALNMLDATPEQVKEIKKHINSLFEHGVEIYRGYVDDPRNTDNAWMETIAMNFHDDKGDSVAKFKLHAGDDAVGVKWMDLSHSLQLFASHVDFLQHTAKRLNANW